MNAKIVASYLSLQSSPLDKDIIYEIVERLDKNKNAIKNWNRIQSRFYFIMNRTEISNVAYMIHKEGHMIHNIARDFYTISDNKNNNAFKIHKIGIYYHSVGKKILDYLMNNYKNIPSQYFILNNFV